MSNKKGQTLIIVSILILLATIVGLGLAFYYVWNNQPILPESNNTEISNNEVILPQLYTVSGVLNVDTIQLSDGQLVKLLCVASIKENDSHYEIGVSYLKEMLLNKQIHLENASNELGDIDRNNVIYRYVWLDDVLINQNLVRLGYAKTDPSVSLSGKCQAIMQNEIIAQTSQIGIWQ